MKKILYCLLLMLASACKEKYSLEINTPITGYLVIEGVVNSGQGETELRLSRTGKLDERTITVETGASVVVEGDDNSVYALLETDSGHYRSSQLPLNSSAKYRIRIRTTGGREYLSEFKSPKNTPPIDSLTWKMGSELEIFVNSHDAQNSTRYYKWEYAETWEFNSRYISNLVFNVHQGSNGNASVDLQYFDPITFRYDTSIYTCWRSRASTEIEIGSTAKLAEDVVYLPITSIPKGAWEVSKLYSINVKQYALSREGYEFYDKMKKNSESLGSLFDAQPSELKGNILCTTDPREQVIGYFDIASVTEKRIFIHNTELPDWGYSSGCPPMLVVGNNPDDRLQAYFNYFSPIDVHQSGLFGTIISFNAAPRDCIDCRLSGTNVKPSFWP